MREATRNYPPMKEDVLSILEAFEETFPELKATERIVPRGIEMIPFYWFEILDAVQIYKKVKSKIKKKHRSQIGDAFAYLTWLSFRLHLCEDVIKRETPEEVQENMEKVNRESRSRRIISSIRFVNNILRKITKSKKITIIRENVPESFNELPLRCNDLEDFTRKIQSLACLFEVDSKAFKELLNSKIELGSITLFSHLLEQLNVEDHFDIITTWKHIIRLRQMPPTHHKFNDDILESIAFFGEEIPINYTQVWDKILTRFYISLEKLLIILRNVSRA